MSGAPQPVPQGRSDFDIVVGMFRRRRQAVASAAVLAVMFYGAIWAPVLANSLPLRFRGVDVAGVRRAARNARLEAQDLAEALGGGKGWTRAQVATSFGVVASQCRILEESLEGPPAGKAASLGRTVRAAEGAWESRAPAAGTAPVPADPAAAAAATAAARELKTGFPLKDEDLHARTRWPAFRALDGLDVFFMVLSLSGIAALWWLRSRPGRPRRPWRAAATALVPALLAAGLWASFGDTYPDPTDYRGGIAAGTITCESVTYAPVPYGLNENDLDLVAAPPSRTHILGTDESGRDILCRILWGARISLSVGFVAVGIYCLIGVVVGAVAGYAGGWADIVISRVIEWVICFPVFFLILVTAAFLNDRTIFGLDPPQLVVIMVIIGVTGWTTVARLVRAEFLKLSGQDFVVAARALGFHPRRIVFRHILPNAMAPVLVSATFGVAGAILLESGLSFLGLGITVPKPSWGGMLYSAQGYEQRSTWIFLWPGLAIFLVITCYNLVGEALRDALDPRLRQ